MVAIPFGSWLNSSSPERSGIEMSQIQTCTPRPGRPRQRLAAGAKLGHDLEIRFEVEKLGKARADDKVVVDKGDGGHVCSCGLKKPDGAALIRPTRAKDAYLKRSIRRTPQFC